jgi:hypothetical protein
LPLQPRPQGDRIVPALVACRIKEGDRALAQALEQIPGGRLGRRALQLGFVGGAKCIPIIRLAVEALAQRVARRDVPEPEIDPSLVLGDATRPQPVDQDARPVAGTGGS